MTSIIVKKAVKPDVKHLPFNRVRKSTPKEGIYLKYWQNYVTEKLEVFGDSDKLSKFEEICKRLPYSKYRIATVAASFIAFMGCNCGRDFTIYAENFARKTPFLSTEDAYLAAWAIKNKRESASASGLTLMEAIIERRIYSTNYDRYTIKGINLLNVEDVEIFTYMVGWWSSKDAEKMREVCEVEFEIVNKELLKTVFG